MVLSGKMWRLIAWIGFAAAGLCLLFAITVRIYGQQTTMPTGFQVGEWKVGGMEVEAMRQQWDAQLARLSELRVELRTDRADVGSKSLPLGELGLRVDDAQLQAALRQLFSGTSVERAKQRWLLRHARIDVPLQIDADALTKRVRIAWSAVYARAPVPARRVITPEDRVTYDAERLVPRIDIASLQARLEAALPPIGSAELLQPIGSAQLLPPESSERTMGSLASELGSLEPGSSKPGLAVSDSLTPGSPASDTRLLASQSPKLGHGSPASESPSPAPIRSPGSKSPEAAPKSPETAPKSPAVPPKSSSTKSPTTAADAQSVTDPKAKGSKPGAGLKLQIVLPIYEEAPPVTVKSLQAQGVERKIIEFSTPIIDASAGRLHNVKAPAAVIQDMLLKPGEIFDYAKVVEQAEKQFGFQESKVILNGKLVNGVGGGICQVSTTLYNAALLSGLEIVERRNHTLPISYAPIGLDATFSSGWINFRFRNSTGAYLLIRTETTKTKFTVKLFGRMPGDISYEVETRKLKEIPPGVQYVSNPQLKANERVKLVDGKPGYVVETYRITKKNGTVIARDKISRDHYAPQPTIIAVKKASSSQPAKPDKAKVEDGVKGPVYR